MAAALNCVCGLHFSRNFGKKSAIYAGLFYAKGHCCVVIDCDLQHPPEKIVEMYKLWEREGYEIVEAVKADRGKESPFHAFSSKCFSVRKVLESSGGIALLKKIIDKVFLKYILVGVINTFWGAAVMFGCYNLLHCNYWVSSAANYILGSILSYFLNKNFTFKNTEKGWKPVFRFAVNISVCYLIAYGIAKPAAAYALSGRGQVIQENGAMVVGMLLFVVLNYLGQRFFAFKKEPSEKSL